MAIKHATQATGVNDSSKQVSKNQWNEDHVVEDGSLTIAKTAGLEEALNAANGFPTAIAYSNVIPLDGNYTMPAHAVLGPETYTVGAMVNGGKCILPLRANGSNVPVFSGMSEVVNSSGYENIANVGNVVLIEALPSPYSAGALIPSYSILQYVGDTGVTDLTAPTISSAIVANATPTILNLTFSEPLTTAGITLLTSIISGVTGHTVAGIAFNGTTGINVTFNEAFVNGEATRTFNLTQSGNAANQIKDVAGNLLANVTGYTITNNVAAADVTAPTLVSAIVANATPNIINLTFNEPLTTAGITLLTSLFAVNAGHAITAIAFNGTTGINLTVDTAFVNGEAARTLAFTNSGTSANQVKDVAGNLLANFSGVAITNNVAASAAPLLLLHMDGANGSTTFTDSSSFARTVTANAGAAITTSDSKFGGACADLVASGRYLELGTQADFNFTSNIFTLEFWIKQTQSTNGLRVFTNGVATNVAGSFAIGNFSTGFGTVSNSGYHFTVTASEVTNIAAMIGNWVHYAVVADGTNISFYVNGTKQGNSVALTGQPINLNAGNITRIGKEVSGGAGISAQALIDEFVIWPIAKYTGNFTPPTAPY